MLLMLRIRRYLSLCNNNCMVVYHFQATLRRPLLQHLRQINAETRNRRTSPGPYRGWFVLSRRHNKTCQRMHLYCFLYLDSVESHYRPSQSWLYFRRLHLYQSSILKRLLNLHSACGWFVALVVEYYLVALGWRYWTTCRKRTEEYDVFK